mgnify:CR=1 FL=1
MAPRSLNVIDIKDNSKSLSIPLNDYSSYILEKYDYKLPEITNQKFNEYILTRLRTHWGVNPNDMSDPFKSTFLEEVKEFVPDMIFESDGTYFLTTQGKMWADHISSQLFASEE